MDRFRETRPMRMGVEIRDDLRVPLEPADKERLRSLFLRYGLLYFPDQQLSMVQQIEVLGSIGPVLHRRDGVGYISTDEKKGELGRTELIFHSDLDFATPYTSISLLAKDVVPGATSTRFASNRGAWRMLSEDERRRLASMRLTTALPSNVAHDAVGMAITPDTPHATRAPIVEHPLTGEPLLMISQQAVRFEDMEDEASRALLLDLHARIYAPGNVQEHFWRNGDLVVWDNIAWQHARGPVTGDGSRTLQRVVVADVSYFDIVLAREDEHFRNEQVIDAEA